ncbi:MAG: hypothetical protein QOI21_2768 [Actinomycetota bacterium]|jgi:hydroxymethylpyrimidine pyrophosphatase-like HAD family hydrolase|nr:hypothetical protein [Actinomycetota bacterium]
MTDVLGAIGETRRGELVVPDLLFDLHEITDLLLGELLGGRVLDAYLLAAGAVQIVEDRLTRDTLTLRRAAAYVARDGYRRAPAQVLTGIAVLTEQLRALGGTDRRIGLRRSMITKVRDDLARAVVVGVLSEKTRQEDIALTGRFRAALRAHPVRDPADMLRLPTCFRSFDQQPEDMLRLAEKYARTLSTREAPVLVLGVRTSGSYLAPLVSAALTDFGFGDVSTLTIRPHRSLWPEDGRQLRLLLRRGAAVAVVDDPPVSGSSIQGVAERLLGRGARPETLTLLLPLFGTAAPAILAPYRQVTLPFEEWAIHERFEPGSIRSTLAGLLNEEVAEVTCVRSLADGRDREHASALFRVRLTDERTRLVVASGAGVGYLGRHALAVAAATPEHLARTYDFRDGLVFRDWLPEENRVHEADLADVPALVSYIEQRAAAMPAAVDRSRGLAGRHPAWEAASSLLALGYGRLGVGLRTTLLDPAVRRLCAVTRPSVVDGATGLTNWFRTGHSLRKVAADVRDFSNSDLTCYDPAFDLAGIDPGSRDTAFVEALRAAYPCSDERFLLYQLVHLAAGLEVDPLAGRAAARAAQRYVAAQFGERQAGSGGGPLCALDIDGVLESGSMGFPAITPAGMLSVRALAAHGYRPVVVTGRCLDEVRERCEAYGLAGGVAEYGALAYERESGGVVELVTEGDLRLLATVRNSLRSRSDVVLDEDYQHSVRACCRSETGLSPLPAETVEAVLEGLGGDRSRVRAIPGQRQTDFVARATDKGQGLAALARLVSGATVAVPEIELAVGDTEADLPMLAVARHAYAPANASAPVQASGVVVLPVSYAAAVAAAVGRLLGHPPGGCPTCSVGRQSAETGLLLALLGAQEAGARGIPRAVLRGMVELLRARR